MARIAPLLIALATVNWRELRSLNAVTANNFFLFCMLLMLQPESAAFMGLILGLLLFFPLSADPMKKIPPDRLALFPLTRSDLVTLRAASVFLSPAVWIIVAILLWGGKKFAGLSWQLLLLAIFANAAAIAGERVLENAPRLSLLRDIPQFPSTLGGLIRKNLREMFHVLDPYAAFILAASGTWYRFFTPNPTPDAVFMIALLVVLSLSTYTQRLFALDAGHDFLRYRLLPLKGWQILLAKDIAFLLVLAVMVAPLAPGPGLAAGLAVLAIGHHPSVLLPIPQSRWRFIAGASLTHCLFQTISLFGAGTLTARYSLIVLPICAILCLVSLFYCGWEFDRRHEPLQ